MSERSKAALERVKRIIRELQAKTEENGCTEQEAMSAAAKMGRLLEDYGLNIDEVGIREDASQCRKNEVYAADQFAGTLISGIKSFCDIIAYQVGGEGHGMKYCLFGTPHDLEIAQYLYEVCAEAMEHDWVAYMNVHGYSMKKRASFRMGFSGRVYERLRQMKAERDARNASTCRDLIVLKDQLVKAEWAKQGIRLVKSRGTVAADNHAYGHGHAAGGRVNLNNPITGGPGRDQLR
jgi:uncharacterized protein DUF2786